MDITTIGIDLAKQVFAVHGVDKHGEPVLKKMLKREQMFALFSKLKPCLVAMEACGSSHYWARRLAALGHTTKLIAPQFVKPYVKGNKHDAADAEAICEAAGRPSMRFVAVKSPQSRGLLAEFGLIVPQGLAKLLQTVKGMIADNSNELPVLMRDVAQRLLSHLLELDRQVQEIDNQIRGLSRRSIQCQRLEQIPGIGPITATALVATLGEQIREFKNGRQLAAFLGLVPRQHSSGGKERLQGISKRGDRYLRRLLVHGARAVLHHTVGKVERANTWLAQLAGRRHANVACVAQANKTARIVWVLMFHQREFRSDFSASREI